MNDDGFCQSILEVAIIFYQVQYYQKIRKQIKKEEYNFTAEE